MTADGDVVGAWADKSGNGNDALQATTANKPLYKAAIKNGLSIIRFDGANDWLVTAAFASALSQPNTIVVAAMINTATPVTTKIYVDGIAGASRHVVYASNPEFEFAIYAGAVLVSGDALNTNYNILTAIFSGVSSELFLNGTSIVSGDAGAHTLTGLTVAASATLATPLPGDELEILVYDSALSTSNRQAVEAYINSKWSLY